MKSRFIFAVTFATSAATMANAQASKPAPAHDMAMHESHQATSGWKELDAFHSLLAGTWHPIETSKDFKPIRMQAADLADAAQALAASKIPNACNTKPIREALPALAVGTRTLASQVVRKASDAEVTKALKAIHTRFEVVEMRCKPAKK
ncbi:MAG: hypothetical protein ABI625_01405 [bacterium]